MQFLMTPLSWNVFMRYDDNLNCHEGIPHDMRFNRHPNVQLRKIVGNDQAIDA